MSTSSKNDIEVTKESREQIRWTYSISDTREKCSIIIITFRFALLGFVAVSIFGIKEEALSVHAVRVAIIKF